MSFSVSLESLFTSPAAFDVPASALQIAICRIADGRPIGDVLDDVSVQRFFGCEKSALGLFFPALVVVVAGVRGGKSIMAACAAVRGALTADLQALKSHEIARVSICAPTVDNAEATFRLLVGGIESSPTLHAMVVGEPSTDTVVLRRPDGRQVEIVTVAASRGAVTLRSRWSAGFIFDEVALFGVESQGYVINVEELLRAAETRLVPGAQGWLISSPYGPSGLLYDMHTAHWGKPGRVVAVHAPTIALNPSFPIERVEAIRARSPDVAAREYDAQWVDADAAYVETTIIEAAIRDAPIEEPPQRGVEYSAAMDAATRGNGWTIAISRAENMGDEQIAVHIAVAREWRGSKQAPLDVGAVAREIAAVVRAYRVEIIECDEWGADPLKAVFAQYGISLRTRTLSGAKAFDLYDGVRTLLSRRRLRIPRVPLLIADLQGLRKRASAGAVKIELQRTNDGRHSDYAPSLALAVHAATTTISSMPEWATDAFMENAASFFGGAAPGAKELGGNAGGNGVPPQCWGRPPHFSPLMTCERLPDGSLLFSDEALNNLEFRHKATLWLESRNI